MYKEIAFERSLFKLQGSYANCRFGTSSTKEKARVMLNPRFWLYNLIMLKVYLLYAWFILSMQTAALCYILNKSENTTLQYYIFCEKVLDK